MKQHLTIEEMFNYRKELDNAGAFDKLDKLDALWQPKPGDLFYLADPSINLNNKEVLQVIKANDVSLYYYSNTGGVLRSINISACRPLFSIQQLHDILGNPAVMKYEGKWIAYKNVQDFNNDDKPIFVPVEGDSALHKVIHHTKGFQADELCDVLWEVAKSLL